MLSRAVARDFLRFACVGGVGLGVAIAATYGAGLLANLYVAGLAGWLAAATFTWFFNRIWTFAHRARRPMLGQLRDFLAANFLGFLINYGLFSLLITVWPLAHAHPAIAIAAGSASGLAVNFGLSRHLVFRSATPR